MRTCEACGTPNGNTWWSGRGQGFVCEGCALDGKGKVTPEEIRTRIAARVGAGPPARDERQASATRTKIEDAEDRSKAADSTKEEGIGGPIPRKPFTPFAGLTKAIRELEAGIDDEPPTTGRKRFEPLAGLEKAEAETAPRVPRFSVGV